jgi:hypothetical protein
MNRTIRWLKEFRSRALIPGPNERDPESNPAENVQGFASKVYDAGTSTRVFVCADGALVDVTESRDIEGANEGEDFEFVAEADSD